MIKLLQECDILAQIAGNNNQNMLLLPVSGTNGKLTQSSRSANIPDADNPHQPM